MSIFALSNTEVCRYGSRLSTTNLCVLLGTCGVPHVITRTFTSCEVLVQVVFVLGLRIVPPSPLGASAVAPRLVKLMSVSVSTARPPCSLFLLLC